MKKKTILVSSLALATATPALAETAADLPAPDSSDIVVTASRSGDAVADTLVGSSVTVLDSQALESRQTRVVSDVLRDVPGVAVSRTGAVGGLTEIRIRGAENNHVLVFIDGIKASDPFQGQYDFGNLIADELAHVEVLRGQQSALYGSDAIGGVISYTTLSGREAPGYSARIEGGSFATISAAARAGGTIGETFDYALSGSYLRTAGYPVAPGGSRDLGSDSWGLSAKLNWTPAPNFKLTAVARYSHTRADQDDQLIAPGSPIVLGYPVITAVDTPGSYYRNNAFYGLVRAELSLFDDAWTNAVSGQITDAYRDAYSASGYAYGDRGRRYRGSFESTVRFGDDHVKNRVTFAVDAEREEYRNVDPTGFAFTGKHTSDQMGVVLQYDLTVGERLAISASGRIDANQRFSDDATYRLTGSYLFATGTRIHAAYGTGVKDPGASDLYGFVDGFYIGNPGLRPERSRGWEAGAEQRLLGDRLVLGATYFRNRFSDRIETVGTFINGQFISTTVNSAFTARQSGVELYGEARLGDWRAAAAYTYLKAPQTISVLVDPAPADGSFQAPVPVTAQAVRRPRHTASFNLSYAPEARPFSATLTVRYTGRQTDFAFNPDFQQLLVDLKAYTLVNLGATYDVSPHVQLFGRVENLFDQKYQEVFTFAASGIAGYGGLRVKF